MWSKSKYVIGVPKNSLSGLHQAVIIPETMNHSDVQSVFKEGSITSAGFCSYEADDVCVFGESVSLNVKRCPYDITLVGRALSHPKYMS